MSTPQATLFTHALAVLEAEAPRPVPIERLYEAVERATDLDDADLRPPTLRGRPTGEPSWRRNLRNALQQGKRNGRLANVAKGAWPTARPAPARHVDPDRAWAAVRDAALAGAGNTFESPTRCQRYRVGAVEGRRVEVDRLDGSKPATLSAHEVQAAAVAINAAGGRTGRRTLHYTVAKETALVYLHPDLGWDGDEIVARRRSPGSVAGRPAVGSPLTATEALDRLTRDQILGAIAALDGGATTAFSDSTTYDVVHGGHRYAPLQVVAVAAEPVLGRPLRPHSDDQGDPGAVVKGGAGTPAFRTLERCGFEVVPKSGTPERSTGRPVRFWALAADPRVYRIDDAVRELRDPDLWTTKGRDLRPGDRVVVWRTSGGGGPRGVVALGEVVGPVREVSDADNPYWRTPDGAVAARVPVRYAVPHGLPLLLGDDGDGPARALSVARARGGTVFNVSADEWAALTDAVGGFEEARREAEEDAEEARVASSDLVPTEKEQLVRARRGQGVFRRRVEAVEAGCRMTGTTDRSLLVASHIKPWRSSTDAERLDGHNGLLLAPHVDRLFDSGLVSFTDDGRVLVASPSVRSEMVRWGLDPYAGVGPFTGRQVRYLAYHRAEVFRP